MHFDTDDILITILIKNYFLNNIIFRDKSTKSHLKNVYACVTMEIVAAAFGAAINCYLKSSVSLQCAYSSIYCFGGFFLLVFSPINLI